MKHSFKINTMAFAVAGVLAGMIGFNGDAFARKTCADGSYPPCDTEGETATNNLSVPLWLTSDGTSISTPGGAICSTNSTFNALVAAAGTPIAGYPISPLDYYFVQGIHKWQAPCATWDQVTDGKVTATAAWGDNLSGAARLKAGSPIRVEIVLTEDLLSPTVQPGYVVVKLDPAALDRESPYGTLATDVLGTWQATPADFTPLVYDSQAKLDIYSATWVDDAALASAEVNATGKVVYGYNLRVPTSGVYTITYTFPNVTITGVDAGSCVAGVTGSTCTLMINVGGGGGQGGRR